MEEHKVMKCGKCRNVEVMTKRVIAKGTSKECHTWWCPYCNDQIAEGSCTKASGNN